MAYRSAEPFFHDRSVHLGISQLASAHKIVIFAGAGVTIDRTGLGWGALMTRILSERELSPGQIEPKDAQIVARVLDPVAVGSLAAHYFRERYSTDAASRLDGAIRDALYSGTSWQSGLLCRNVVRLALALKRDGKEVDIVTTNYDTFLEEEYSQQAALSETDATDFASLQVKLLNRKNVFLNPRPSTVGTIDLTYLHGRIDRDGNRQGKIAFSELDYHNARSSVVNRLSSLFKGAAVLIVGSSLTDAPLLAALHQTKQDGLSGPRFAITPVAAYDVLDTLSPIEANIAKKHIAARMSEYDCELLFPDFYFQVAQFCQELVVAARAGVWSTYHRTPEIRYGTQLQKWWSSWEASHLNEAAVKRCYGVLAKLEGIISATTGGPCPVKSGVLKSHEEQFKVTLWVRWNPSDHSRRLTRWQDSNGMRLKFGTLRSADLMTDSKYESVRAFLNGAPQLRAVHNSNNLTPWKSCLSVPLQYEEGGKLIPIGVISLVGSKPVNESRISVNDVDGMQTLVEILRTTGQWLIQPTLGAVDPI